MKDSTARKLRQIPAESLLVGVDPHKKRHAAVAMTLRLEDSRGSALVLAHGRSGHRGLVWGTEAERDHGVRHQCN